MRKLFDIAFPIIILLAGVASAAAQTTLNPRVELRGTIVDEAGAVVPRAAFTLDDGHGHRFTTATNELGHYRLATIPPGSYQLTVSAAGFAPLSRQLIVTQTAVQTLNLPLAVTIAEEIEVKPEEAGVSSDPDRNMTAVNLTAEELAALPEDRTELLQMLQSLAGPGEDAPIFVDGFSGEKLPSKDAIQAVRINSNPFSAAYANAGRGRIEVITRPGTDRTRGSVRFNFNDESLNARNAAALHRAPLQIRDFSAQIGGPLIRRRWDYYFEANVTEQDENAVINATILDPQTLLARPFSTVALTPTRGREFNFRSNYLMSDRKTLGFRYNDDRDQARGQGLAGGFDLPERAYARTTSNQTLRFSLTSIPSGRALNELRMTLARRNLTLEAESLAPATVVLDSFYGGGNQGARRRENRRDWIEINDQFSYTRGRHAAKAGVEFEAGRWAQINFANYGGSFTFGGDFERDATGAIINREDGRPLPISSLEHYRRTLAGLPGYRPSQFSIVRGDPRVDFRRVDVAWFAQDDWKLSPKLTLSVGLRHEIETDLDDRLNLAPRVSGAWSPGAKRRTVLRAGAGLFYERIEPELTIETRRLDGVRQQQFIVRQPTFYLTIPPDLGGSEQRQPTIRTRASDLDAPALARASSSYERDLGRGLIGSVAYNWQRGYRRLRTRNINAPLPDGSGRPQPDRGPILQYESTGFIERHELQASWRYRYRRRLNLYGSYTLATAYSDTDGTGTVPADSYHLAAEWGRAITDQRHTFTLGGSLTLPHNWQFNPFIRASSGRPFNITTGRDNNADASFADRPAFAAPGDPEAILTRDGAFNLNPHPGDKIIPRNFGRGPGLFNVDLNLAKTFVFGPVVNLGRKAKEEEKRFRLTFSASIGNLFNHTNPTGLSGVLSSTRFGTTNRALAARRSTLSLRLNF
jgi:hypothetical protein